MADEQQAADTQAAETTDQAAGEVRAQRTRQGPTKQQLKRQLAEYEAKNVITNADAKAIHDLRRRIEETR